MTTFSTPSPRDRSGITSKASRLLALRALPTNPYAVPPLDVVPSDLLADVASRPRHARALAAVFRRVDGALDRGAPGLLFGAEAFLVSELRADLRVHLVRNRARLDALIRPWRSGFHAVRSCGFEDTDGVAQAGAFVTRLWVQSSQLPEAIADVFVSYVEARRYQQLAAIASGLSAPDRARLRASFRDWARAFPGNATVILQAMVGGAPGHPTGAPEAPRLDQRIVETLTRRLERLEDLHGGPLDTEWVWLAPHGAVSLVALTTDTSLPIPACHISAVAGVGTATAGDGASATSVLVPRGHRGVTYFHGGGLGRPCEPSLMLSLVQARPLVHAGLGASRRVSPVRARRAGALVIAGDPMSAAGSARVGTQLVAPSLSDALRIYYESSLDPRIRYTGVVVMHGTALEHPAIVFRQLGLPVVRVSPAGYRAAVDAAGSGHPGITSPTPPVVVFGDRDQLDEILDSTAATSTFLIGWSRAPELAPPRGEALDDRALVSALLEWEAQGEALLSALDRDSEVELEDVRWPELCSDEVGEWIAATLRNAVHESDSPELGVAELGRLAGPTGIRRHLVTALSERWLESPSPEVFDAMPQLCRAHPEVVAMWFRAADTLRHPSHHWASLPDVQPWIANLRILAGSGRRVDGRDDTTWAMLQWPTDLWLATADQCLFGLVDAVLHGRIQVAHARALAYLSWRCHDDPLCTSTTRRAIRDWIRALAEAGMRGRHPALVAGVVFFYHYTPPRRFAESFAPLLPREDALRSMLAALTRPGIDLPSPEPIMATRSTPGAGAGRFHELLNVLEAQLSWLRDLTGDARPAALDDELVAGVASNLANDVIELYDLRGKVLACELACGPSDAFSEYWEHLERWSAASETLSQGPLRALDRANLFYVRKSLEDIRRTRSTDLSLDFDETWRDRLARPDRPSNLHKVHNSLHQGSLSASTRNGPIRGHPLADRLYEFANAFRLRENPVVTLRPDQLELDLGLSLHKTVASLTRAGWRMQFTEPPGSPYTHRGRIGRIRLLEIVSRHIDQSHSDVAFTTLASYTLGNASIEIRARPTTSDSMSEDTAYRVFCTLVTVFESTYKFSGEPLDKVRHLDRALEAGGIFTRTLNALLGYRRHLDYSGFNPRPLKNLFGVAISQMCLARTFFEHLDSAPLDDLHSLAAASRAFCDAHRRPRGCKEEALTCFLAALLFPDETFEACTSGALGGLSRAGLARHLFARRDYFRRLLDGPQSGSGWGLRWNANPWLAVKACLDDDGRRQEEAQWFLEHRLTPQAERCFFAYFLDELLRLRQPRARERITAFLRRAAVRGRELEIDPRVHAALRQPTAWAGASRLQDAYTRLSKRDVRYAERTPLDTERILS